MSYLTTVSPTQFLDDILHSKAARRGEIIRRKVRDVERWVGREAFVAEMRRRGFRVFENAGQFVVFCNAEPLRQVV